MKKQCIPAIRMVIVAISICLISHAYAASPFYDLDASPDIAVDLSGATTTGNQAARDNLSGTITLQVFTSVAENADLIAYEHSSNGALLTFDTSIVLPSAPSAITARPADVVSFDGINYTKVFDAITAGIPDGVRVDAVATDGNDLLLSFDITVDLGGGLTVTDEDLIRWDGASFTLFLDTSIAGIDPALDLDGAHRLKDGNLLLSFDGSGSVGSPAVYFDEDILEYDPSNANWELAYDASAQFAGWADGPDLDAFDVTESLIIDSWLQVSGSAQVGTVFFTVADVALSAITTSGMTAEQVAQTMADTINTNPTLASMGVTAIAVGDTLYTNGALTHLSTTDGGLTLAQGLAPLPQADGDMTLDGEVNSADILLCLQVLGGAATLSPLQLVHGDVAPLIGGIPTPDELFTLGDLLVIQRKALGQIHF